MLWILTGIIISYLFGSIPTAYIFGRLIKGIDIRKFGSGNVGATNALRVLGKGAGIAVLLLDVFKGFLVVVLLGNLLISKNTLIPEESLRLALGLSSICGHNWTVFLNFRGGKGIATTLGVLLGLSIKISGLKLILGLLILTWILVFLITRIVSLASVLSGVALPVYMLIFRQSRTLISAGIILCVFVIIRHKNNLKRLFAGKEPALSFRKPR